MTDRIRLHYAPDNASLIIRLALEELGLPYDAALVDRAARAQEGPAYRAINPNGLIPAIETRHGAIFETAAILLWLDEAHPGALAPAPGDAARGDFLKWLIFLANTVHPTLRMRFYPEKYIGPDSAAHAALLAGTQADLTRQFDTLERHAGGVFGAADPTMIDLYLAPMLRWTALYPSGDCSWFNLSQWSALRALAQRVETRPSAIKAKRAEGLGETPFSAPRHATPPEGSAT
ncbi:glutathione S-transferase family protein [Roseovarius spongiae]|uniref:Glutathione S-transferase family protein n=1 Tax=Roseovarius spongiae TaxID=2320272 RepID=A0A3A8B5B3_9RHOB|nr:glutathione S-transferase family protein [Roseovarius spongiae]RKF17261.1 glutathione S-transferase family protein [Roseovarius spongiae]